MKLLPNRKLSSEQFQAAQLAESVMNSADFRGWFLKAKFSELGKFSNSLNSHLYMKFFVNNEYRFSLSLVKKPWIKFFDSSPGPESEAGEIQVYENVFAKMTPAERAGLIAHEITHIMGFTHSKKSPDRDKSLPHQVQEYVKTASELILK